MLRPALVLLLCLPLAACATGVDRVKLLDPMTPTPADWETELVEAAHAFEAPAARTDAPRFLLVLLDDARPDVTVLGTQRNTWGTVMGTVELDEGLRFLDVFEEHLVSCFRATGLELVPAHSGLAADRPDPASAAALAEVEIYAFSTDFVPGVFTVDARARVQFTVRLRERDGGALFDGTYQGEGEVSSALGVTRAMFEESLNIAHAQAMRSLHDDLVSAVGPTLGVDVTP